MKKDIALDEHGGEPIESVLVAFAPKKKAEPTYSVETHATAALRDHLDGDPAAFAEFVRLTEPSVRLMVLKVINGGPRVDDAVQSTWLGVYEKPDRFRGLRWLLGVARNKARDEIGYRSKRQREKGPQRVTLTLELSDAGEVPIDDRANARQALRRIETEMDGMSRKQREALKVEVGFAAPGEKLDGAGRGHLTHARRALQKKIDRSG